MTTLSFSLLKSDVPSMTYGPGYIVERCLPRQSKDKASGKLNPPAYQPFTYGIPPSYFDAFPLPTWDTSKFLLDSILGAVKEAAIEAATAGKMELAIPDRLPDFLASCASSGRITKDDLAAWLKAARPFILAYVQERQPDAAALKQEAMTSKLVEWATMAAIPKPGWQLPQWESLDRLVVFLADLSAASEPGEFPAPKVLEVLTRKIAANKPSLLVEEEI